MKIIKRRFQKFPEEKNPLFERMLNMWINRCFDEYSDKHLLIRLLNGESLNFYGQEQLKNNEGFIFGKSLNTSNGSRETFLFNFAAKLMYFEEHFGQKNVYNFVKNQLAAGKSNYDESQFLRALSEMEILNYFSAHQTKNQIEELIQKLDII